MRTVEAAGKTRHEAIQTALQELGAELHEVQIQILEEGSRGLFGLGAKDWRVRLSTDIEPHAPREREPREPRDRGNRQDYRERQGRGPRPRRDDTRGRTMNSRSRDESRQPREARGQRNAGPRPAERQPRQERRGSRHQENGPEPRTEAPREPRPTPSPRVFTPIPENRREEANSLLQEILSKMGIEASCTTSELEDNRVRINVESEDSALLIGRKGRNLQALQYLINRMMHAVESPETSEQFVVDVESYLDRRKESLEDMARHFAERAKETGRDVRLKPMNPQERRIIHLALQDDPDVRTFSLGTAALRTVVISPKNASRDRNYNRGRRGNRNGYGDRRRDDREGRRYAPAGNQLPREDQAPESDAEDHGTEES